MNLRRQMITVIDLRNLYGMAPLADTATAKVLVIEHGDERYGLIVDSVETIITAPNRERIRAPRMIRGHDESDMRSEMQEIINIASEADAREAVSVFDVEVFLKRLVREMGA